MYSLLMEGGYIQHYPACSVPGLQNQILRTANRVDSQRLVLPHVVEHDRQLHHVHRRPDPVRHQRLHRRRPAVGEQQAGSDGRGLHAAGSAGDVPEPQRHPRRVGGAAAGPDGVRRAVGGRPGYKQNHCRPARSGFVSLAVLPRWSTATSYTHTIEHVIL